MDNELKSGLKKLLLADSLLHSSAFILKTLDEVENELEEIFGKKYDKSNKVEDLFKNKEP